MRNVMNFIRTILVLACGASVFSVYSFGGQNHYSKIQEYNASIENSKLEEPNLTAAQRRAKYGPVLQEARKTEQENQKNSVANYAAELMKLHMTANVDPKTLAWKNKAKEKHGPSAKPGKSKAPPPKKKDGGVETPPSKQAEAPKATKKPKVAASSSRDTENKGAGGAKKVNFNNPGASTEKPSAVGGADSVDFKQPTGDED